jgi:hypothetical protein
MANPEAKLETFLQWLQVCNLRPNGKTCLAFISFFGEFSKWFCIVLTFDLVLNSGKWSGATRLQYQVL